MKALISIVKRLYFILKEIGAIEESFKQYDMVRFAC